jgi:magnesium transporter
LTVARTPDLAVSSLTDRFVQLYPGEVARKLETLPIEDVAHFVGSRSAADGAALLERLTPEVAEGVLRRVSEDIGREILSVMDPGRAAPLLARLEDELRSRILEPLSPAVARELRELISYPEDSAGRIMDARVMTFLPDTSAKNALSRLRRLRSRIVHDVFLVDQDGHLVGDVLLQDLALASPGALLRELVRREVASVSAMAPRSEVLELLGQRRLSSVPVVDFEGRIVGVIRHDALVAVAQEEASADMQKMVGVGKEERALSKTSLAIRKRLPWLQINLATAFLAASVVGVFEDTIARFTALAVLLPVVAGQSGNTGAQALAVTMRGLALREIRPRQWFRLCTKEVRVAFFNGIAVALTTALGVYVWSRSPGLALVIGLSMVISMVAAGISGASIPIVLISLGQDPAQASSIILTTVTDVVGFFSFLGIATLLAAML